MPATDLDAELTTERDHLDASRAALRRMRERAEALYATGDQVAGDAYGAESLGRALSRRIAELADDPETPIFFGRLQFTEPAPASAAGSASAEEPQQAGGDYHIGRRHVTDERGEPMVLDWRAPISRAFYQASARDPQGVRMRRRFGFAARRHAASAAGSASAEPHAASAAGGASAEPHAASAAGSASAEPHAASAAGSASAVTLTGFEDERLDR